MPDPIREELLAIKSDLKDALTERNIDHFERCIRAALKRTEAALVLSKPGVSPLTKEYFRAKDGLTLAELKAIIKDLPDVRENGEPFEVWIETSPWISSQVRLVSSLNLRDDGCDILLDPVV